MIEFVHISKKYQDEDVLKDLSFTIENGKIFGIVGASGAGKSTLLRLINRLESLNCGTIRVNGIDISALKDKELRNYRKKVAMIFQNYALMETKTVYQNIALPLECQHVKKDDIKKRVYELAKLVGIEDKLQSKPKTLSGGQQQRVAIARALTLNPTILLADEATSALDPNTTKQILDLLKKINEDLHISIVLVTHQMEVVKQICDEVIVLKNGALLFKGSTETLFLTPNSPINQFIQEDEPLPDKNVNIKLFFHSTMSDQAIITQMARNLQIDFSIVWGKLENFKDHVLGSLIINIEEKHMSIVCDYLKNKQIEFKRLKEERV